MPGYTHMFFIMVSILDIAAALVTGFILYRLYRLQKLVGIKGIPLLIAGYALLLLGLLLSCIAGVAAMVHYLTHPQPYSSWHRGAREPPALTPGCMRVFC